MSSITLYMELGRAITMARAMKGLTQAEVGQALMPKVTRAAIANMEAGRQGMLVHVLCDIARVLEMDPGVLLRVARKGS